MIKGAVEISAYDQFLYRFFNLKEKQREELKFKPF